MSNVMLSLVWALPMTPVQKLVLASLADQANDSGDCWPSVDTICQRTCLSERGVQKALVELEKLQAVTRIFRNGHSTRYRLTPASCAPPHDVHPARRAPTPAPDAPPPPHDVHPTPAPGAPRTISEPSIESSREPSQSGGGACAGAADNSKSSKVCAFPAERNQQITKVFEYWKTVRNHPSAKLDDKRIKSVGDRLRDGYTVEQLCLAIDGVQNSPHHRGENDRRTVYDALELICRDAAHVDQFMRCAKAGDPGVRPNGLYVSPSAHFQEQM